MDRLQRQTSGHYLVDWIKIYGDMNRTAFTSGDFGRKRVLIIGDYEIDTTPFIDRGLFIDRVTIETAHEHFLTAKAIIVADFPSKYRLIRRCYEHLFLKAADYELEKRVILHNNEDLDALKWAINHEIKATFTFINNLAEIAEYLARYVPGPPPGDFEVTCDGVELDEEKQLLLRRSFFDCERIHVQSITGGLASLNLFKVYPWIGKSRIGPSPSPFFVKIAGHDEIEQELKKYTDYTDNYIPFHYRPNCRPDRCVSTRNFSSLVGDFVDEAISLRSALQDVHYSGIIFSLFEKTLKGFRLQPFVSRRGPMKDVLATFIKNNVIKVERFFKKDALLTRAQELGLNSTPQQMLERLLQICPKTCLTSPYHGDLNFRNVMVKGDDAILIDFYSVDGSGPLTADPATLEVSLSFEFGAGENPDFEKWRVFIDEAYNPVQLLKPLALSDPIPNEYTWLRRAIRETRHILIGCDCCGEEIQAMIAACLMRIARVLRDDAPPFEIHHRAYALVVAERIIDSMLPDGSNLRRLNEDQSN